MKWNSAKKKSERKLISGKYGQAEKIKDGRWQQIKISGRDEKVIDKEIDKEMNKEIEKWSKKQSKKNNNRDMAW